MKRLFRKACVLALGCVMTLSAASCGGGGGNSGGGNSASSIEPTEAVKVWGAYSTAKITRNVKESVPYEELNASVNIEMMKNETEGGQLVITANDKAIKSYELIASDLTDGKGNKILKDDISVYHQKYMRINNESDLLNKEYVAGDYVPDMLLPMATAKAYGENKVAAGENQGITVEVKTSHETVPGTYTGKFELDIDGEKKEIPVTVTVWDIEYEGRREFQSSFLIYRNSMLAGEYEVSDEIAKRYEDFLLDYKINSYIIKDSYTVDETVETMIRLFDNSNYNSIVIPKGLMDGYSSTGWMADQIVEYIVAVTKLSTPEKPYMDYLYLYPSNFDEADQFENKYSDVVRIFKKGGEWDKTLARALSKLKGTDEYKSFTDEFKAQVDEAVLNIPAVFTNCTFNGEWVENSHVVFCPYISLYGNDAYLQKYQDAAETNGNGDLWVYTCVKPNYPNPTFHLDDYNLGTRISGWMEKKWNVNGYLYYAVNTYAALLGDLWRDVNPYETAERANYVAGDGFLVYPGKYYGSEYPFASLRLVNYRDSMDDYDMLSVYEKLAEEKAAEYGIEIDAGKCLEDLYDSLFVGSSYYTDDSLVVNARRELAARILALKGEDGIIAENGKGGLTVYSSKSTLKIDGKTENGIASGNGYKYVLTGKSGEVKVEGTAEYTVSAKDGSVAAALNSASEASVTSGSNVAVADGKAEVTVVSVYRSDDETIDGATKRYMPYVQISLAGAENARSLDFKVVNTGESNVEFTVRLVDKNGKVYNAGSAFIKTNGERDVHVNLDATVFTEDVMKDIVAVRLAFANVNDEGTALAANRSFTVSDMRFYK